jgi:CheY-like chemotaxis protein
MTPTLLVVDDDRDDQELLGEAFDELGFDGRLIFLDDGDQLIDYLNRKGEFADPESNPAPSLVILDLNMPRLHGLAALADLRANPRFRRVPVIIMTTSWSEDDIARAYDLGANSFIIKPVLYDELLETVRGLVTYWLRLAELPPSNLDA